MKGYVTKTGYMGYVPEYGYMMFSTESEYEEYYLSYLQLATKLT